ncbi:MAG: hypothetical protein HPY59_10585 [Anaerolineae bacterium]|nr:hypothetical protein [Anaerolineae bacterium]
MTHTIHRYGKPEDLEYDYSIIFISARNFNRQGSQPKIRRFLELAQKHHAVNFGNMEAGSVLVIGPEKVIEAVKDGTTVQAVFSNQEDVVNILSDLVKEDLGLSVVVQGLEHRVRECCMRTNLKPHTWNHSLGIWGKTELLPEPEVLEVTTMCGHGLVAVSLVKKIFEDVRNGKTTLKKAAQKLAKPCICGMINPVRLERLLERVMEKSLVVEEEKK